MIHWRDGYGTPKQAQVFLSGGFMLLVLFPAPYVDASSSWAFANKWQRIAVGAGGMVVELFLAYHHRDALLRKPSSRLDPDEVKERFLETELARPSSDRESMKWTIDAGGASATGTPISSRVTPVTPPSGRDAETRW